MDKQKHLKKLRTWRKVVWFTSGEIPVTANYADKRLPERQE